MNPFVLVLAGFFFLFSVPSQARNSSITNFDTCGAWVKKVLNSNASEDQSDKSLVEGFTWNGDIGGIVVDFNRREYPLLSKKGKSTGIWL